MKSRPHLQWRSRWLRLPNSRPRSSSSSRHPSPPLRPRLCRCQCQDSAAAFIAEAKGPLVIKVKVPTFAKVKVPLLPQPRRSRHISSSGSRSGCRQGQGPTAASITDVKVTTVYKAKLPPESARSGSLMTSRSGNLLPARPRILQHPPPTRSRSCCPKSRRRGCPRSRSCL